VIYYYLILAASQVQNIIYIQRKTKRKQTTGKRKDIFKIDIYLYNQDKFAVFSPSSIIVVKRCASADSGTSFS